MTPASVARPVVLSLLLTVLLSVVVPILFLSSATARFNEAWVAQTITVVVCGGALAAVLTAETLMPVQLCFWTFSYIWLAMAPLGMLTRDTYPWGLRVSDGVAFTASGVVLSGVLIYVGAAMVARTYMAGRALTVGGDEPRPHLPGWLSNLVHTFTARRLVWNRVVVLCGVSYLLAAALVPRSGGVGAFFQSREAANEATAAATGSSGGAGAALLNWGLSVPPFWALLALLHMPAPGPTFNARFGRRVLITMMVALNLIVNNPISQPRFWAGTVLLSLLFTSRKMASVRLFRFAGITLLASLVLLFPLADYFRYEKAPQLDTSGVATQLTTNPDYDAYQQIQAGVVLVHGVGHQPKALVGPPLFWVPRSIWPGKPEDTGVVIAKFVGYTFLNLSSPLWVETYVWGGLFGTFVVFALLGLLSRRADYAFHRHRFDRTHLASIVVVPLAFYQFIILRGSLLQAMAAFSLLVSIPLLITRHEAKPVARFVGMPDNAAQVGGSVPDSAQALADNLLTTAADVPKGPSHP